MFLNYLSTFWGSVQWLEKFKGLRKEYGDLAYYTLSLYLPWLRANKEKELPYLPLKDAPGASSLKGVLPEELLNSVSLRDFLDTLISQINMGLKDFDEIFGGRA